MNVHFPLALLLQAVDGGTGDLPEEMDTAEIEALNTAVEGSGLFDLVLGTGPLALVVLLILLAFSVGSWAIAFSKYSALRAADRKDGRFQRKFRRATDLGQLSGIAEDYRPAPLVTVFEHGYDEVARQVNTHGRLRNGGALERALRLGMGREVSQLQRNMGWLATTASATPFIGLFGTVWGVLESFRGLGQAGGATLRAVAPGIADALVATAAGLFAAIPALIFFNYFSQRVRVIRARMENFGLEFYNLAERNYGEVDGILEPERSGTRVHRGN